MSKKSNDNSSEPKHAKPGKKSDRSPKKRRSDEGSAKSDRSSGTSEPLSGIDELIEVGDPEGTDIETLGESPAPIEVSTETIDASDLPESVPVLALRDVVIFPFMIFPVLVGRESSLAATSQAVARDKYIFLVAQKNSVVDEPGPDDLFAAGTLARIVRIIRLPNGLMKVLVDGLEQAFAKKVWLNAGHLEANVELAVPTMRSGTELEALSRHTSELFREYVRQSRQIPPEVLLAFENITDPRRKLFYIAAHTTKDLESKQQILEITDLREQYLHVSSLLASEIDILKIEQEIDQKVQSTIQKSQRKYFLSEQIKILQQELGEDIEEQHPEFGKLVEQLNSAGLPPAVRAKADEELQRLRKTPAMSPESGVIRSYLETMASLPWKKRTRDHLDIEHVRAVLDADHYGLEKPKERILEHIAVLNLVEKMRGQILCLVGPPGVGKTSLARSIAHALGREFVRISLGGIRDEAEIRGHRRTYIGAMPGKILLSMKRADVVNPLMLLDEVDKMAMDFRGDPSSALLEVLDPEQNTTFADHYLEVDYDLSNVFFVTTANVRYNIPHPLLDRMEVIEIPGYLEHDKLEIAKRHVIPGQLKAHGLTESNVEFKDDAVLRIIRQYTEEAGVRGLVRQIARIARKVARQVVTEAYKERGSNGSAKNGSAAAADAKTGSAAAADAKNAAKPSAKSQNGSSSLAERPIEYTTEDNSDERLTIREGFRIIVTFDAVEEYLGVPRFQTTRNELSPKIGAVMGLAWTSTGGDVLPVEALFLEGTERLTLTGQLGDVMKESAQAALSFIRSRHKELKIDPAFMKNRELHVHLPEGAIPKDGPSAGITLIMAIISAATGKPVRGDLALTGEITLRGHVLAIGGLQEKLLAAKRTGIKCVLIPHENIRTLAEIPATIKDGLNIVPIEFVEQAVPLVFDLVTDPAKLGRHLLVPKEIKAVEKAETKQKRRKPAAKQSAVKKPVAKKSSVKKSAAKKPAVKKPAAKQSALKKPAAKKPALKKPAAKKPTRKR